jgi:hypothetical protein
MARAGGKGTAHQPMVVISGPKEPADLVARQADFVARAKAKVAKLQAIVATAEATASGGNEAAVAKRDRELLHLRGAEQALRDLTGKG